VSVQRRGGHKQSPPGGAATVGGCAADKTQERAALASKYKTSSARCLPLPNSHVRSGGEWKAVGR